MEMVLEILGKWPFPKSVKDSEIRDNLPLYPGSDVWKQ